MISVIVSVYNSEAFLKKYLQFANDQFLDSFEIIFVDANSSDRSLEIIENFKFRNGISVKILPQNSRITVYQAWNIAVRQSTQKYIVNWNTDDILFPSALETYSCYLKNFPEVDLFYSSCFISKDQSLQSIYDMFLWPEYSHKTLLQRCICGPFPMVKKSAIESVGYFSEKYISSGDYDMWLKLSKNDFKFKKIPEIIGSYYRRESSVSLSSIEIAQKEDREIKKLYA